VQTFREFILVGNSLRLALPVLQATHEISGARCVVAGTSQTRRLRWSGLCRRHVLLDFDDDKQSLERLNALAEERPGAILVPFDCEGIRLVNRLRANLMLDSMPIPDLATLDKLEDKWRFHEFCVDHSLPCPATEFVGEKSGLDFDALASRLGVPFVVKPTNWSGSLGVQIVRSRTELEDKIVRNAKYDYGSLIAQKYVQGVDMCLNVLAFDGHVNAISIQRPGACWIDFVANDKIEALAGQICRGSRFHGIMNLDVRLEEATGEVFLIESNPRCWASLLATVSCGLNIVAECIRQIPLQQGQGPRRLVAGRFYQRHPLLRPSSWRSLFSDTTHEGRLLRLQAFDPYVVGQLVWGLPAMAARHVRRSVEILTKRRSFTFFPKNGLGSRSPG